MGNFYVIGTKYGVNNDIGIETQLWQKQAIAMGFCWDNDLTEFYNGDHNILDKLLRDNGEKPITIDQVKLFLSLKPGDLIAVKSSGSPEKVTKNQALPSLVIIGYAIVVEKDRIVYRYDPDLQNGLGHLINVDFLEVETHRKLRLGGFGRTIDILTEKEKIELIFGSCTDTIIDSLSSGISSGATQRNTSEKLVIPSASYIRKAIHNEIQQGVYELLCNKYGEKNVAMEVNYVDIIVITDDSIELIEVKPCISATNCIREGLGQLLSYYHKHYLKRKNVSLTIIGANEPTEEDIKFIKFIEEKLDVKFRYDSWERLKGVETLP